MRRSAAVNLDDARGDVLTDLEHVLDLVHALFADLRDVNETIDVVLESDERSEARELGDLAGDEIADFVELVNVAPTDLQPSCFMPTAMRWLALSTSSTWASTSSPFLNTSLG
jgi:hypothetical protein